MSFACIQCSSLLTVRHAVHLSYKCEDLEALVMKCWELDIPIELLEGNQSHYTDRKDALI